MHKRDWKKGKDPLPGQSPHSGTLRSRLVKQHALAVAGAALSTLLLFAVAASLERQIALLAFVPALVFSAWAGGWGGGLLALALSATAAACRFNGPAHEALSSSNANRAPLAAFIGAGLIVCALCSRQRTTRRQAAAADARRAASNARRAETARRESEARKSAVLEVALGCIITADAEGRSVEFNPAAERTFG